MTAEDTDDDRLAHVPDPAFERLLEFLRADRGFDVTGYKRPSLTRRVTHRMRQLGIDGFEDYQDHLQVDPDEFTALFDTILINVTSFFRDADAWTVLGSEILPEILGSSDGQPVRVWSAGCSSGQEPYSIAMVLHDLLGEQFRDRVKVYATDVDEDALNQARRATFTGREVESVPEPFRDKYFDVADDRWTITPDLRRSVIFGRNDLTCDALISRIDVLLCRNTLMYFNSETQQRLAGRLSFALRPNGILFLGKAEMLLNHGDVLEQVDLPRRFFRRRRSAPPAGTGLGPLPRPLSGPPFPEDLQELHGELVRSNPVAQIAVGADGRLAMANHRATAMLGLSDRDVGRPFQDLEVSYRPLELRSQIATVLDERAPLWVREVEWRRSGPEPAYLDVQLAPLFSSGGAVRGVSISFSDVTRFRQLRVEVEDANRRLEAAYEELQSTNEELETTNEELQSTVEELETTNEELQSTNEELETMNEELQSANDELQSTNDQLRERTGEIGDLNLFMQSILGSLRAAVIVLDRDLVVQVWTPQAHDLWGLHDDEAVGQHLYDLDTGLPLDALLPWIQVVLGGKERSVTGEEVDAVNRRGRRVRLRVSVTGLDGDHERPPGVLVLMESRTPDEAGR